MFHGPLGTEGVSDVLQVLNRGLGAVTGLARAPIEVGGVVGLDRSVDVQLKWHP